MTIKRGCGRQKEEELQNWMKDRANRILENKTKHKELKGKIRKKPQKETEDTTEGQGKKIEGERGKGVGELSLSSIH